MAEVLCPDPGPCLYGPDPHQWRPDCQPDRDGDDIIKDAASMADWDIITEGEVDG